VSFSDLKPLIRLLADGQFHSGEALGAQLGITRAAVWKRLQSLAQLDLPIESQRARGYRITGGLQLLDEERILAGLSTEAGALVHRLYCFDEIDSTNRFLLQQGEAGDICVAERQTAGRGRRGRQWFSPYGCNLYMSIRWHFHQGVAALEGLSLAVGVLLAEALQALGLTAVELKWPNDLLCAGCKLGGVLIEVGGDLNGDCAVVVGVGLNVDMEHTLARLGQDIIGQPWTDLRQQGFSGDRNELCSAVMQALLPAVRDYPAYGFSLYRNAWESRAALLHQSIEVHAQGGVINGVMLGVDSKGSLRVRTDAGETLFSGGEISLRSGR
jgi:BirA family biotin operon repressor/biotin-[acetyl-CoA-carboxylase] ligase